MQQVNQTKWADHVRGCADLAKEIAARMDIRDDPARQAMLATIIISADRHNLFLEPLPTNSKTPVIQPEPAAVASEPATKKGEERIETAAEKGAKAAAAKADAQIESVPRITTSEQADGARRATYLSAINSARELLNKEGHQPPITPQGLNAVIKHDFAPKTQLGGLDNEELERLMMFLQSKLNELRAKKAETKTDEIDF